ncbi:MAG: hypothetical protein KatS3mg126_1797 [Lysobacteraceae bacterium]|nr:MAG: hypothetical protein KatS3mg126_1797 [Xanthomonadaceae bacterium]
MLPRASRRRILVEMGYRPLYRRAGPTTRAPLPAEAVSAPVAARPPADPLWQALLRAAGAEGEDPATLGWRETLHGPAFDFDGPVLRINPLALRKDPSAKRTLWRTLRVLRRQRLGKADG